MKAEAIAIMSLMKNSPSDVTGKGRVEFCPYFTAYFLSLMRLVVVLARKTMSNFCMGCGTSGERLTWSAKFDAVYVHR